jgi:hypothetical protein
MEKELYNLSFREFKKLFGKQATKLLKSQRAKHKMRRTFGLLWSKDKFLQAEHANILLAAIKENIEIDRKVLIEYKDYRSTCKPIADYCKKRGWYLY